MKTKNVVARGGFKIHAIAVNASNAAISETALCGQTSIKRGAYSRGSVWRATNAQSPSDITCDACKKHLGLK